MVRHRSRLEVGTPHRLHLRAWTSLIRNAGAAMKSRKMARTGLREEKTDASAIRPIKIMIPGTTANLIGYGGTKESSSSRQSC